MEKELKDKYENKISELLLENRDLLKELDLLNIKIDLIKSVYKIIEIKTELEGDKIPLEIRMVLNDFFNLTTFKVNLEVKNGTRKKNKNKM